MKPASTMKVCTFHLQGRCKFGIRGQKKEDGKVKMCPYFHPKVCEKYLAHGKRGCNSGCKRLHPKMCQNVKKCYYSCGNYHMNDTKIQHQPVTKSDTASPRRITQDHCASLGRTQDLALSTRILNSHACTLTHKSKVTLGKEWG